MGNYSELRCDEFVDVLASKAPVPGGGGAAALVGALAASLCCMSGRLTLGKRKYITVESDINLIISKAEILSASLIKLIDEDAAAFEPLSKAYSKSKSDHDYKDVMREVTLGACRAPLEIMKYCTKAIDLLHELYPICSNMMLSDVGCSAALAKAALESAAMNVLVNTRTLIDCEEAIRIAASASSMLEVYAKLADELMGTIMKYLMGE